MEAALLPEDSPRSPKEKPCGVQGVPVEERQGFVNAKLHRLVRGCIRAGGCWEEDVKPGDEPNICPLPAYGGGCRWQQRQRLAAAVRGFPA